MVLLYKGGLSKAYTSKDETMGAWVLYQPRWKRPDGAVISSSLAPKNGHEKKQYMKIISRMLMICFIIGIFTILIFVIVIHKVL